MHGHLYHSGLLPDHLQGFLRRKAAQTQTQVGNGLGLSVVKRIVETYRVLLVHNLSRARAHAFASHCPSHRSE